MRNPTSNLHLLLIAFGTVWLIVLTAVLYGSTVPDLKSTINAQQSMIVSLTGSLQSQQNMINMAMASNSTVLQTIQCESGSDSNFDTQNFQIIITINQITIGGLAFRYFELQPFGPLQFNTGGYYTINFYISCPVADNYTYSIPVNGYGVFSGNQVSNFIFSDPTIVFNFGGIVQNYPSPPQPISGLPENWSYKLTDPATQNYGVFFQTKFWSTQTNDVAYYSSFTLTLAAPVAIPTLVPVLNSKK